jgi:PAS domain-containing protein
MITAPASDLLLASLPWPVAGLDGTGTIVLVNPAWAAMRPSSPEARSAVVGANLFDLCLGVDGRDAAGARDLASAVRDLLAGATVEVRSSECPCHAGDRTPRFRLRAVAAKDHPVVKALLIHEEIPVSERMLHDTQRRCQVVTDAVRASGFLAKVGPSGRYSIEGSTHSGVEVVSGYTPEELDLQGGWISTVLAEDRPTAEEHMRRALAGRADERSFRRRHSDGSIRWVRSVVHPVWSYAERASSRSWVPCRTSPSGGTWSKTCAFTPTSFIASISACSSGAWTTERWTSSGS